MIQRRKFSYQSVSMDDDFFSSPHPLLQQHAREKMEILFLFLLSDPHSLAL